MSPIHLPDAPELSRFSILLVVISFFLVFVAWMWQGVDFAVATLVGCSLMVLNFLWTRSVVRKAFLEANPKLWLGLSYGLRFGATVMVLYIAIREIGLNPLGVALGVSVLMLTAVGYTVAVALFPEKSSTHRAD